MANVNIESTSMTGAERSAVDLTALRVAVVHDFLYTFAGAERVVGRYLKWCRRRTCFRCSIFCRRTSGIF